MSNRIKVSILKGKNIEQGVWNFEKKNRNFGNENFSESNIKGAVEVTVRNSMRQKKEYQ